MLHSESPLCQEHGCPEHSYNPIPAVDEKGLVKPPTLIELFTIYSMEETLAYKSAWKLAASKQHQVDLIHEREAVKDALEWARQERDISIKAEKNRVINALIPYLKHNHRDRPVNPNLYGGPTYSDATDCEACGMVGQLRRERS